MFAAPAATANSLTFDFAGTLSVNLDAFNVLGGLASPVAFSGSYTYDSLTPDGNAADPDNGVFLSTTAGSGIDVSFSGFSIATNPASPFLRVSTSNAPNAPADIFSLRSLTIEGTGGFPAGWEFQVLVDLADGAPSDLLTSDALPTDAPDLSLASFNFFQIVGGRTARTSAPSI